ncbi:TRAP transporter small permease [Pararhodobacter zhoushanensis]|uniref:TRAP transporter small permease protein n=1 Tax=Pararhodobacter zhoushanensis TaxID=2479545 RepID=A0ABT3H599_9RHOB|nr:TRAP transporter small permease [Pararhodobacter zhoushanensis]MCW1934985.1 TRAP transporter small permease [Pararhodobacter zhoushanensis]
MNGLSRLTYHLMRVLFLLGSAAVVLMMLHIGVDVLARALMGRPTVGMVETVTNYYMIAVCFLPLAFVQVEGGHLTVDSFTQALPGPALRIVTIGALLVAAGITGLLTWHSAISAIHKTQTGEYTDLSVVDFPLWPARWLLVLGYGATFVTLCLQIILGLAGRPLSLREAVRG